jgi:hypothetical protein
LNILPALAVDRPITVNRRGEISQDLFYLFRPFLFLFRDSGLLKAGANFETHGGCPSFVLSLLLSGIRESAVSGSN